MPRTGIAVLLSLIIIVTYGAVANAFISPTSQEFQLDDDAVKTEPEAKFTIIF